MVVGGNRALHKSKGARLQDKINAELYAENKRLREALDDISLQGSYHGSDVKKLQALLGGATTMAYEALNPSEVEHE